MKKFIGICFSFLALLFIPAVTLAGNVGDIGEFGTLRQLLLAFQGIINTIVVPFIFTVAFVVFLYGIFSTFILGASDEAKQEKGKSLMLYSIIGFVLMVSIWGIVNIFANGLGLNNERSIITPRTEVVPIPRPSSN